MFLKLPYYRYNISLNHNIIKNYNVTANNLIIFIITLKKSIELLLF